MQDSGGGMLTGGLYRRVASAECAGEMCQRLHQASIDEVALRDSETETCTKSRVFRVHEFTCISKYLMIVIFC